jgi:hypothetical protein
MLISLIAMTALMLAEGVSHFAGGVSDVGAVVVAENRPYKPEDPSTLTLAVIGAGTLALYFGSRRRVRARRSTAVGDSGGPHFDLAPGAAVQPVGKTAEQPSRGAA